MAFKSGGGFVIRPVVTAGSVSDISSSVSIIPSLESRVSALEYKIDPATVSFLSERINENSFDIIVNFSHQIPKILSTADFQVTGGTLSDFRRISGSQTRAKVTATSTQVQIKLLADNDKHYVSSETYTKQADRKVFAELTGDQFQRQGSLIAAGFPIYAGVSKRIGVDYFETFFYKRVGVPVTSFYLYPDFEGSPVVNVNGEDGYFSSSGANYISASPHHYVVSGTHNNGGLLYDYGTNYFEVSSTILNERVFHTFNSLVGENIITVWMAGNGGINSGGTDYELGQVFNQLNLMIYTITY